jgi:ribonuclease HII
MSSRLKRVDWTTFEPAPVVGVDEVGRGCLAGPVVAAAVILSRPQKNVFRDSKLVPAPRREELFTEIQREHRWAVGFATVLEINRLNIFHASLLAMRRAVMGLGLTDGAHLLIDGKFRIPRISLKFKQTALVQGDSRAEPISAASIAAKVTRDRFMRELAEKFPDYGFEIHKGYGTPLHRDMLAAFGPCKFHRRHFRGVVSEQEEILEL